MSIITLIDEKFDWTQTDKYNYGDINKVEGNVELIFDYFSNLSYPIAIDSIITNRNYTSIDVVSSINRLEDNIEALRESVVNPPEYLCTKLWDRDSEFSYIDANRWELNLFYINLWADRMVQDFKYSGTFSSGQEVIL